MWQKMKGKMFGGIASIAYLLALTGISTNSWWTSYEPEIPKELQK
ncbi:MULTISPECIES: cyclic lactone autoinducer peptide [Aneurinibacillus]|uniref:Cyclic lactone autoinducer peptide n=1 Tax=Aneurinibacillus thermoaerophilus TaxID=143495 RepID=A0A1G7Y598_ANETH|nr:MULTISPECIES: cyclic lactone autoinducer peptide [Aneurinibacillus]MED0677641.1 cyclic lactone autoinducer peptide [Aneurinibacillus thermoaerophilus]MED0680053.1 cyclic lactone autoinducer peptide [Aneurinibacillus thermoaerophilus]MED0736774.1 cyclic lactone autoinducer peptide [Aneurinibacillus thermoaerophilus]MED0758194.1 cyclic lactone autoinducer peptide [Aneurinibacillus thermoaerophilus]MED0761348.1 cyclic lactone autoinducer peptide [Aneurinibacillus thermoaerophilus]